MQRLSMDYLRSNVLFFPYGDNNMPGVPRAVRLTLTVGNPLLVPRVTEADIESKLDELADLLHRRYYSELQRVFDENKVDCFHAEDTLDMKPPVKFLTHKEFESEWKTILESEAVVQPADLKLSTNCKRPQKTDDVSVLGTEEYVVAGFFWFFSMLSGHFVTLASFVEPATGVPAANVESVLWQYGAGGFFFQCMFVFTLYFFFLSFSISAWHSQPPASKCHQD
jgi:hypothetical protein